MRGRVREYLLEVFRSEHVVAIAVFEDDHGSFEYLRIEVFVVDEEIQKVFSVDLGVEELFFARTGVVH